MKKNNYLIIAVFVIIAAVYNIVVFSVGGEHAAAFWSAYGFTMFAVVAAAITYALAFKDGKDAAFLNIPVTIVATAYFFVQLCHQAKFHTSAILEFLQATHHKAYLN